MIIPVIGGSAVNEPPDPRTSLWATIAFYLRFFRMQHGESGDILARRLGCSRSSISRLEAGEAELTPEQADKVDEGWNLGGLFGTLVYYATLGHDPDWLKAHLELEARAKTLRIYEGAVIPGLFQTPEYARSLFAANGIKDIEKHVKLRMERQAALTRPNPPQVWALLAEPVLEWQVGGPEVMRGQLERLLELADLPEVSIRIVSKAEGAHAGLGGTFKIMTVGGVDLVYTDAIGGGRLARGVQETERFSNWYESIGAQALPAGSSRRLIKKMMEGTRDDSVA
ncbi:helix-turn-helix domain-containing protein [Actinomadura rayongensis]|uniref:Helix-turn-helix domain-containing protein n=1 Tax=Actinomadura rayongensis TaxID=1429076 RepID=A0A6I4WEU8_9ACTN|nr:helix-turn-helix transcriptional regulator [Actinomadura rayongensis]MXQ68348.1 helix-turn-helix domain-containing protein [Actinomadura rayongensis]